jgi:nicotinate-nucleotide adenylyltransferase
MGGAFDPIHRGHYKIAKTLINLGHVNMVVLMPTYVNQFGKLLTDHISRIYMIKSCLKDNGVSSDSSIRLSDFEIKNKIKGGTYDVITMIKESGEKFGLSSIPELYYVIGMDQANEIHHWQNWEKLITMIPFIVINRKVDGSDIEPNSLWFLKEPHRFADTEESSNVSSSEIRRLISLGDRSVTDMISESVQTYIHDVRLYQKEII